MNRKAPASLSGAPTYLPAQKIRIFMIFVKWMINWFLNKYSSRPANARRVYATYYESFRIFVSLYVFYIHFIRLASEECGLVGIDKIRAHLVASLRGRTDLVASPYDPHFLRCQFIRPAFSCRFSAFRTQPRTEERNEKIKKGYRRESPLRKAVTP